MDRAEQIRRARRAAGLTQRELARRSGVTQPSIAAYESGRVAPTARTVERLLTACRERPSAALTRHREDVLAIIRGAGGRNPRVFGSVAEGRDAPDSDLDLLIDLPDDIGVFALVDLAHRLEGVLGVEVDIVDDHGSGRVLDRARRQAVPL